MHIHTAPDVRPRRVNDPEPARQAAEAGMQAILLKSHVTCTADRATIARQVVPNAILATGHVSAQEIVALVRAAISAGVCKVLITHPKVPWVDKPADEQEELRDLGATFERCYVSSLPVGGNVPFARIVSDIRQVGVASTVLTTDFGAATLPTPVEGMRTYLAALLAAGFSHQQIRLMAGENPAGLLGLS